MKSGGGSSITTIALLGVTGNTGQVVLRQLLQRDDVKIVAYARSRQKVLQMFPEASQHSSLTFFFGSVSDSRLMKNLLQDASVIISTIGSDGFTPAHMQREAAAAIVAALESLRSDTIDWKAPRLIWLASSSTNERFAAARPALVNWLIQTAFQSGYEDLWAALHMIEADANLASVLRIQPGVLVDEDSTGHELSVEMVSMAASYKDLGAAIAEVALDRSFDSLHEIGVSSKQGNRAAHYAPYIVIRLFRGFLTYYFPYGVWLDGKLQRFLPWYTI